MFAFVLVLWREVGGLLRKAVGASGTLAVSAAIKASVHFSMLFAPVDGDDVDGEVIPL